MIVGFIGFGEVNKKLATLLSNEELVTSKEGRSAKTIKNIKETKIKVLPTFKDVAINSDILFSATSPKQAIGTAEKYGKYCRGIYVDLNNVSPDTVLEIEKITNNFVDGSIVGGINNNFTLYLSSPNAFKLDFLKEYFPIKIISENTGDASKLKLLRSIYTKSVAAVLIELFEIAENLNLEEELLDTISLSEGEHFKDLAKSRIKNTKINSKRKKEEIQEILEYFDEYDLKMVESTFNKLSDF